MDDTSVPITIDDMKQLRDFKFTRCDYFTVECDTPSLGWTFELEGRQIPLLMAGGSGIIFRPSPDEARFTSPEQIGANIPGTTQVFKVPHHGSVNGTFDNAGGTPWLDHCPHGAKLAISSHVRPHTHPDQEVINAFDGQGRPYYRTDRHHHLTFCTTDGNTVDVNYSHV